MIRMLLIATAVAAVVSGISFGATAQTCAERCDAAYKGCAALEAAGCEIGGQLAGEAAEQLGNEVPIPGMGALFGSLAHDTTAQKCVELLGPCQQIRTNCLAGCPPGEGSAAGSAAAAPEVRHSTLRVFADRPRTIVYINEQRMGATPEDALEPFVSPELPVGRYWVRLASPDGEWEWRGEKTVEEGNLNAVEGTLANRRVALLDKAHTLDAAGEAIRAAGAYRELLVAFPNDAEIKPEAEARLAALFPAFKIADEEMFRRIGAEAEPQKRAMLCRVYLDEFAGGAFRPQVQTVLTEIESKLPRPRQPGEPEQLAGDDRAQVEAVMGEDLGQYYTGWQSAWAKKRSWVEQYPKFSDYMYFCYETERKSDIALTVIFDVIGVAGLVVGPVLLEKYKKNNNEDYLIGGAIVTGESGAIIIVASIVGPVKSFQAKKKREKLAGMQATARRFPNLQFVGLSPLVDRERSMSGLALSWEY